MKISDIVKVNIENVTSYETNSTQMNSVAAVLFVHKLQTAEVGNTDTEWVPFSELDPTNEGYIGDDVIGRIESTYRVNGGISLVCKRVYILEAETDENVMLGEIIDAINGGNLHTGLETTIKNVQLAWDSTYTPTLGSVANAMIDTAAPENTKILFVTVNATPAGLSSRPNIFYHYSTATSFVNYYESAAAMAYLSKINYVTDEIKDYEYTEWLGSAAMVNLVDEKPDETQGIVNIFTPLGGRKVLVGGNMTDGVRLITYYFELILSDKIANVLAVLVLDKLKFVPSTYSQLYNSITIQLDVFANNGLFDRTFVASENQNIFRDNIQYTLIRKDEILLYGYTVSVLPPTANDLATRNYTGVFIHFAISNQIRTIEVTGLTLGGVI